MSKYAYLGPVGTFTEAALRTITGGSDQLTPCSNVTAALDMVRNGQADFALVPIENSVEGVVARTLDELAIGEPLIIVGEVLLPVTFALMVKDAKTEIKKIATHPHAEAQCRKYIAKHYPNAEIISTNSTAAAAEALAEQNRVLSRKISSVNTYLSSKEAKYLEKAIKNHTFCKNICKMAQIF